MYRNTFERAFSDISPKTPDEEFARKILNAADRQKPRTAHRKAVILPIAAAIVAVGTITASAAGGLDLFGAFRSYFSKRTERSVTNPNGTASYADLSAAGMAKYDEVFDAGDYTVQINGLIADSHYAYLSYDVTYRDKKYFDGGEVAEKFREGSPVIFFEDRTGDSFTIRATSRGEPIGTDGATVSYVVLFAGEFTTDPETGEYPFALTVTCADDPSFIAGECPILGNFPVNLSVPPTQERTVPINGALPASYKRTTILKEVSFGPLSLTLHFDNDIFYHDRGRWYNDFKLKLKDGTEVDLSRQNIMLIYDDPTFSRDERGHQDYLNRETAAAVRAARGEEPLPEEDGSACVLQLGYGTAIDPNEIAEITIGEKRFPVE